MTSWISSPYPFSLSSVYLGWALTILVKGRTANVTEPEMNCSPFWPLAVMILLQQAALGSSSALEVATCCETRRPLKTSKL